MTSRPSDQIRLDLAKMAEFMDGRAPDERPKPNLRVTKQRHAEIVRNPGKHGCRAGDDGKMYFRAYQLEPF